MGGGKTKYDDSPEPRSSGGAFSLDADDYEDDVVDEATIDDEIAPVARGGAFAAADDEIAPVARGGAFAADDIGAPLRSNRASSSTDEAASSDMSAVGEIEAKTGVLGEKSATLGRIRKHVEPVESGESDTSSLAPEQEAKQSKAVSDKEKKSLEPDELRRGLEAVRLARRRAREAGKPLNPRQQSAIFYNAARPAVKKQKAKLTDREQYEAILRANEQRFNEVPDAAKPEPKPDELDLAIARWERQFKQVKNPNVLNISEYKSRRALFDAMKDYRTKAEEEHEADVKKKAKEKAGLVNERQVGDMTVVDVTTPEALSKLAEQGTRWCTKNIQTASRYMEDFNYSVIKDSKGQPIVALKIDKDEPDKDQVWYRTDFDLRNGTDYRHVDEGNKQKLTQAEFDAINQALIAKGRQPLTLKHIRISDGKYGAQLSAMDEIYDLSDANSFVRENMDLPEEFWESHGNDNPMVSFVRENMDLPEEFWESHGNDVAVAYYMATGKHDQRLEESLLRGDYDALYDYMMLWREQGGKAMGEAFKRLEAIAEKHGEPYLFHSLALLSNSVGGAYELLVPKYEKEIAESYDAAVDYTNQIQRRWDAYEKKWFSEQEISNSSMTSQDARNDYAKVVAKIARSRRSTDVGEINIIVDSENHDDYAQALTMLKQMTKSDIPGIVTSAEAQMRDLEKHLLKRLKETDGEIGDFYAEQAFIYAKTMGVKLSGKLAKLVRERANSYTREQPGFADVINLDNDAASKKSK
jgi:hypothetical protein